MASHIGLDAHASSCTLGIVGEGIQRGSRGTAVGDRGRSLLTGTHRRENEDADRRRNEQR
jgi:hypothetical protein